MISAFGAYREAVFAASRFFVFIKSAFSEMSDRTKSSYINEAVKEKLDEMELLYLAESRAEKARTGKGAESFLQMWLILCEARLRQETLL